MAMDLSLTRIDYMQVGVTNRGCMQVLPTGHDVSQRLAVGDEDGVLTCFSMKKRDPQIVFKTLPGPSVRAVRLGGSLGTEYDKIFMSSGSEIRGYSKKGKQFLSFDTNVTEPITSMWVSGNDLIVATDYVYQQFHDCQDANYLLSPEAITDVITLNATLTRQLVPLTACRDRVIRVIRGSDVDIEVELPGIPSVMRLSGNTGGAHGNEICYGTIDGHLGLMQINTDSPPRHGWELGNSARHGGVTALSFHDVVGDGTLDLLVGRDDGGVQVFGFDDNEEPVLRYEHMLPESVTAIGGGRVLNPNYDEVVATTYAGWVLGLTTEQLQKQVSDGGEATFSEEAKDKIVSLRQEIGVLQGRIQSERDKYQEASFDSPMPSPMRSFSVNDKFFLNQEDASYTLSLEVQMAIDNVLLQSDVPVDLLDVDKNSAVVSFSVCDHEKDGNFLLATHRCQANTTRLELKVRSIEGQYGTLRAYITPRIQPKVCVVKEFFIKPLSLHVRVHSKDMVGPKNRLQLTGKYSLTEVHSWIGYCLPDIPERPPNSEKVCLSFKSTFMKTNLECQYESGKAVFLSENISTISIIKDVITKEATKRNITLNMTYDLEEQTIPYVLNQIHPKLDAQILLAKRVQLIEPLKELEAQESGRDFLSEEYNDILEHAEEIQLEFKKQPCHLERLYGMITDLYIDIHKFRGNNVKNRIPKLIEILDNYDLQLLINFFES